MDHWRAIARVFGCLKRTINFGLFYNNFSVVLKGYIDANQITSVNDNNSTLDEYLFQKVVLFLGLQGNKHA